MEAEAHNMYLWERTKGISEEEMFAGLPRAIRGIVTLEVAKNVLCKVRAIIVTRGGQECPL